MGCAPRPTGLRKEMDKRDPCPAPRREAPATKGEETPVARVESLKAPKTWVPRTFAALVSPSFLTPPVEAHPVRCSYTTPSSAPGQSGPEAWLTRVWVAILLPPSP